MYAAFCGTGFVLEGILAPCYTSVLLDVLVLHVELRLGIPPLDFDIHGTGGIVMRNTGVTLDARLGGEQNDDDLFRVNFLVFRTDWSRLACSGGLFIHITCSGRPDHIPGGDSMPTPAVDGE